MLFTIFHTSVTAFSCLIAVFLLGSKVTLQQWCGVLLIIVGLFCTQIPQGIKVTGNLTLGLICSIVGSFCLAASYPFSELVFKRGEADPSGKGPISEEMACCVGSAFNSVIFTFWTLGYTMQRWQTDVYDFAKPGEFWTYMCGGYVLYGFMVGLHSLSFWMSINKLGTVPTAVAKGAQQAGVFVFSHVIYCRLDKSECIDYNYGDSPWNKAQKATAFLFCLLGCMVYALKPKDFGYKGCWCSNADTNLRGVLCRGEKCGSGADDGV
eukprot:g4182.t1